jgi:nifR3 family TIM-barrel protein
VCRESELYQTGLYQSDLYHPVTIGGLEVPGNLFLAPLAGYSDVAFRSLCVSYGSDLTYSEMLSAEGFVRGSGGTFNLLARDPRERYFGAQIFSSSPYSAAKAAAAIAALPVPPSLIDLNCGCPVPKVVKTGAGSALLRNPRLVYDMVKAMKESCALPVTVKIRSGWDAASINYLETADAACQGGAALVCLHARTRAQGYGGRADWGHIRDLKERCGIPVFGSGDVLSGEEAVSMLRETGCDGLMFARGAIGNPFIFRQTRACLALGRVAEPSARERMRMGLEHLDLCIRAKGEVLACREMRKHFAAYSKGLPGGARLRAALVRACTAADYRETVEGYLTGIPEPGP